MHPLPNSQSATRNPKFTRSPWLFIPTLYLAEGIPYVIINTLSTIFYKKLGIDNVQIAFWTGFLYLPWVVKMFWGPGVDLYSTKRNWILWTEGAMTVCLALMGLSLQIEDFFFYSLALLVLGAFISATHDIAVDGFYLLALSEKTQALFVGIRSFFYRMAMIFGSGVLVMLAGYLEISFKNISIAWTLTMGVASVIFLGLVIYHRWTLPFPELQQDILKKENSPGFRDIIQTYFMRDKIGLVLCFILLYRLGEAMLVKLIAPFLLDGVEAGGLGLSTSQVGLAYGTFGVGALVLGGILGGWAISKWGLKKCIWLMVLALNLPDLFYVYMAYAQPSMSWVYPLVALEQFGYGLGFSAYTVFLLQVSKGKYPTAHFAISTGLMALGMMLPGMISGYLQKFLGYPLFFCVVLLLTLPGMLIIPFIPLESTNRGRG